jgi:hypothetical protein
VSKNRVQHSVRWRITDHGGTSWPRFMLWQRIWGFWFYRGAQDDINSLLQFINGKKGMSDDTADNYY